MRLISKLLTLIGVITCLVVPAYSQTSVTDLQDEINANGVSIVSVTGNGSSSGSAITAYLVNEGAASKKIRINLRSPIYFLNSGTNQNMVGFQVYLDDGGYFSDGKEKYIALSPKVRTPVVFIAYCADFDRENPTDRDRFSVGSIPGKLKAVLANIRSYMDENPNVDILVSAQAAIWLAQGQTMEQIRERFAVSYHEEQVARRLVR